MVSCLEENIASAKVIEANGGVCERIKILKNPPKGREDDTGKRLKIYWIIL